MADYPLEQHLLAIGSTLGVEPRDCDGDPAECWDAYAADVLGGARRAIAEYDRLLSRHADAVSTIESLRR